MSISDRTSATRPASFIRRFILHHSSFIILLAAGLPLLLWRMAQESSIWCDETYSIVLSTHPWRQIVDVTAVDAHPPGYYLLFLVAGEVPSEGRFTRVGPGA